MTTSSSAFRQTPSQADIPPRTSPDIPLRTSPEQTPLPTSISRLPIAQRKGEAEKKYAKAVSLYASTNLTIREIAKITGFTPDALSAHLRRNHRDLTLRRYQLPAPSPNSKLQTPNQPRPIKSPKGQSPITHLKYHEAIEACADPGYIEFNVSEIAHMFRLNPTALANQLKYHFPDILAARDKIRIESGLAHNRQRGARPESVEAYTEALRLYRDTDLTLVEVAQRCGVSLGGFGQYLRFYHKDLIAAKALRRTSPEPSPCSSPLSTLSSSPSEAGLSKGESEAPLPSTLNPEPSTPNSEPQTPNPKPSKTDAKYKEAIAEYLTSSEPMKDIAARRGLVYKSLMSYLKRHNITR